MLLRLFGNIHPCQHPGTRESTPPSTPLGYKNILGGMGRKSSGVWAWSYPLVIWLPVLTLERSFWLGRNQFTRRCRERYSRFRRSTSVCVSCRSYPTNFRMTELFFSSTWALSFLWYGRDRTTPLALKNTSHLGQKDARDKRARGEGPYRSEWGFCHPEGYSECGRSHADGTYVALLPGASRSWQDSSGGGAFGSPHR